MSLNGLDAAKLTEAHQRVLADSAGWLLLHYTSRDTIELHARSAGAYLELREAILSFQQTEKAPLYAFLIYREKKVVLKFVPPDTSLILQARIRVHWPAITEHLDPHDATLEAASSDDITENTLDSACGLESAPSLPLVNGGGSRPMEDIQEDEEEVQSRNPAVASILQRLKEAKLNREAEAAALAIPEETETDENADSVKDINIDDDKSSEDTARAPYQGTDATREYGDDSPLYGSGGYGRLEDDMKQDDPLPTPPRPTTSDSSRPSFSGWKPKIRLFTRAVGSTPQKEEQQDRLALPQGMRLRLEQEQVARRLEQARQMQSQPQTSKPQKRPASSKGSKSGAHRATPSKSTVQSQQSTDTGRSYEARQDLSGLTLHPTGSALSSHPTNQTKTSLLSRSIPPPDVNKPLPLPTPDDNDDDDGRGDDDHTVITKGSQSSLRKAPAVTPERQRLMKALQQRKRQQLQDKDGIATNSGVSNGATPSGDGPTKAPEKQMLADGSTKADSGVEIEDAAQTKKAAADAAAAKKASVTPPPLVITPEYEPIMMDLSSLTPPVAMSGSSFTTFEALKGSRAEASASKTSAVPADEAAASTTASTTSKPFTSPPSQKGDSKSSEKEETQISEKQKSKSGKELSATERTKRQSARKSRKGPMPHPIDTTVGDRDGLSDGGDSDDSLMDELQNATFGEGIPVSIPNTPMNPVVSEPRRSPPRNLSQEQNPVVSAIVESDHRRNESRESGRSIQVDEKGKKIISPPSIVEVHRSTSNARKTNVSSGISKRILALEERSQRGHSPVSPGSMLQPISPLTPEMPTLQPHGSNQGRNLTMPSRPSSRASSRLNSIRTFRPLGSISDISDRPKSPSDMSQTVSITARITRTGRRESIDQSDLTMPTLEFQKAQVTIDQSEPVRLTPDINGLTGKRGDNAPSVVSRPESRGSTLSHITRPSFDIGFRLMGRKRSGEPSRPSHSDDRSPTSMGNLERVDEDFDEKKQYQQQPNRYNQQLYQQSSQQQYQPYRPYRSGQEQPLRQPFNPQPPPQQQQPEPAQQQQSGGGRTTRFLKRMSGLPGMSKKSSKNDRSVDLSTLDGRNISTAIGGQRALSRYIVGDLNVQFPDTLYWKRRWVEVDGTGNLVLSPSPTSQKDNHQLGTKKYHLTMFMAPLMPSAERQEAPYSVLLDFINGGSLQLAGEDTVSQLQVLRRLGDAYNAWAAQPMYKPSPRALTT